MSHYQGQRGEHYWVTETYTDERRDPHPPGPQDRGGSRAHGTVARDFDDVLVTGTTKVTREHLDAPRAVAARATPSRSGPEYLAGHETLRYDVEPEQASTPRRRRMAPVIEQDCRADIGGDEQRVEHVDTAYHDLTFKLMLLPVWLACYVYAGKTYNIQVNGRRQVREAGLEIVREWITPQTTIVPPAGLAERGKRFS